MSQSLYEINEQLLACTDMESGEIVDIDKFNELQLERDVKLENVALWYKNLLADADAYKNEKNLFAERERKAKATADSLKRYLDSALSGGKFKTTRVDISYRKSATLEYDGETEVPAQYLKPAEPTIDKTAIKEDIKNGQTVQGFTIVEHNNIQVK